MRKNCTLMMAAVFLMTAGLAQATDVSFGPVVQLELDGSNIDTSGVLVASSIAADPATSFPQSGLEFTHPDGTVLDFGLGGVANDAGGFIESRNAGLGDIFEVNGSPLNPMITAINFAAQIDITISGLSPETPYRLQLISLDSPVVAIGGLFDAPALGAAEDNEVRRQSLSAAGESLEFTQFLNDLDDDGFVGLGSDPALNGDPNPFIGVGAALVTANFTTGAGETSFTFDLDVLGTNDNAIFTAALVQQIPEPTTVSLLALGFAAAGLCRRR